MLGRQSALVEEGGMEGGRVAEGNERGRDGTRHGQREGGSERRRDLARNGGGERERNFKGGTLRRALASIQYIHKPSHNAALAIDTLLLQMKNSEQV